MRYIFTLLIYCSLITISIAQVDLNELRTSLEKVKNDESYAFDLYNCLKSVQTNTVIINGYYGVVEATLAEHSFNPLKKMSYFNNGKDRLEKAIVDDNLNVELRYLRLIIQLNVPSFLGYSSNIGMDKEHILRLIKIQKVSLGQSYINILQFLLDQDICSLSEEKQVKDLLKN